MSTTKQDNNQVHCSGITIKVSDQWLENREKENTFEKGNHKPLVKLINSFLECSTIGLYQLF